MQGFGEIFHKGAMLLSVEKKKAARFALVRATSFLLAQKGSKDASGTAGETCSFCLPFPEPCFYGGTAEEVHISPSGVKTICFRLRIRTSVLLFFVEAESPH